MTQTKMFSKIEEKVNKIGLLNENERKFDQKVKEKFDRKTEHKL